MKKCKKALSIILCLCILLSFSTVSLQVFALDKSSAVSDFEAAVNGFGGNVGVKDPTEDDLNAYNKLVAAYKALSNAEKESIDIFAFDNFYHIVLERERQISITENPKIASYNKQHYINAAAGTEATLGTLPSYVAAALNLAAKLSDKKVSTDDKKALWTSADRNTRIMAGCYSSSNGVLSSALKDNIFKGLKLITDTVFNDLLSENPAPAKPKNPGSAPKPSKYEQGENDPAYIADFNEWLKKSEEYSTAYANEYTHKGNLYIEALNWAASSDSLYKAATDAIVALKNAKAAFDSGDPAATAAASSAVALYNAMSEADKNFFNDISYTFYGAPVNKVTSWGYKSYNSSSLYEACVDIGNAIYVDRFVETVAKITEPYERADIDAVKAAYALVPETLKGTIPEETLLKYKAILACIGPDEPTGEMPNLKDYKSTKVKYNLSVTKRSVTNSIGELEAVLLSLLDLPDGSLQGLTATKLYTNETVAFLAKKLFPLVGGLTNLAAKSPADLASKLDPETNAGAIAALNEAANTLDSDANKVGKLDAWQYLTVKDGDFGFANGDREGFIDALSSIFRPLSIVTMVITLENKIDTSNGTYTYGAYEDLVPVFEALGIEGFMSSHEYTLYVNAGANSDEKMDRRIRPILVAVCNLIDSIANSEEPLTAALELLPKAARLIDTGLLDKQFYSLKSKLGLGLGDNINLDLTTEGIFNLVAPKLSDLEVKAAEVDENGTEISPAVRVSINLDKDNFLKAIKDISGCGKFAAKESVARGCRYYVTIEGDAADTFTVLFKYLHSEIKANKDAIGTALGTVSTEPAVSAILKLVVNGVASLSAEKALRAVVKILPIVRAGVSVVKWIKVIFR